MVFSLIERQHIHFVQINEIKIYLANVKKIKLENLFDKIFSFLFAGKFNIKNIFLLMDVKERILVKATEEFLNKGIRNMSVQSLVVPLGISTKTFYKYFKNKEELLEDVLIWHYNHQFEIIKDHSDEQNPVYVLLNIWRQAFHIEDEVNNKFYQDVHHYYPELEKRVEEEIGKYFWVEFKRLIQKGIDEGFFLENILPDVILESIAILYGSVVRSDQFDRFNTTTDQSFQNTVATIIRGICTDIGISICDKFIMENQ